VSVFAGSVLKTSRSSLSDNPSPSVSIKDRSELVEFSSSPRTRLCCHRQNTEDSLEVAASSSAVDVASGGISSKTNQLPVWSVFILIIFICLLFFIANIFNFLDFRGKRFFFILLTAILV
jgi:hypothetical protein